MQRGSRLHVDDRRVLARVGDLQRAQRAHASPWIMKPWSRSLPNGDAITPQAEQLGGERRRLLRSERRWLAPKDVGLVGIDHAHAW